MLKQAFLRKLEKILSIIKMFRFFMGKDYQRIILFSFFSIFGSLCIILLGIWRSILILILGILILGSSLRIIKLLIEMLYSDLLSIKNRKKTELNSEEKELVNDAVELIKKVDDRITIAKFNVYSMYFGYSFFKGTSPDSLDIYIIFKKIMFFSKDICFKVVVHEILHSQNLRNNICIFKNEFLEGLNEYLTIWLISNYSKKYKIVCNTNKSFYFLFKEYKLYFSGIAYSKEVILVHEILKNAEVDMKELFVNYVEFNPEYFKKFVPEKYLR